MRVEVVKEKDQWKVTSHLFFPHLNVRVLSAARVLSVFNLIFLSPSQCQLVSRYKVSYVHVTYALLSKRDEEITAPHMPTHKQLNVMREMSKKENKKLIRVLACRLAPLIFRLLLCYAMLCYGTKDQGDEAGRDTGTLFPCAPTYL